MIRTEVRGSFSNVEAFLKRMQGRAYFLGLDKYGPIGVRALQEATPKDSRKTSESWYYEIYEKPGYFSIRWLNSNVEEPGTIPVAVLIQYGHSTRQGAWVEGFDYINPAMRPIFEQIAADMWKEVTRR